MSKVTYFIFATTLFSAMIGTSAAQEEKPTIVFLGDSLTAGYGVDPDSSYPSLIKRRIEQAGAKWSVVNAGISGDTSAGGLRRLSWLLKRKVDVLVVALGSNDGLRGISPEVTRRNLRQIILGAREKYPQIRIVLAGALVPPSMGPKYSEAFRIVFPKLARETKCALIPFLLEGVAAEPSLNLSDGIHPNEAGYKIVAENVWKVLSSIVLS